MSGSVVLLMGVDGATARLLALYLESTGTLLQERETLGQAATSWNGSPPAWCLAPVRLLKTAQPEDRRAFAARFGDTSLYGLLEPESPPPGLEDLAPLSLAGVIAKPVRPSQVPSGTHAQNSAPRTDVLGGMEDLMAETGMGEDLTRELARSYASRGDLYLRELDESRRLRDQQTFLTVTHALKGMAANLRLDKIVSLADALRNTASSGNWERVGTIHKALEAAHEKLIAAIQSRWPSP
ncbi:MAG: Hpt domain-containing protein [Deltaproteobacteria bacterium]|nr:Hpt domain-containing protein [Deltaproteobacteria bacterium]